MIIACPECANPFELRDEQIAALVQLECPSCAFRMILDFAAANDPSLVEAGMKMASGFRSAADYRAAIAAPPRHLEPVEPEPESEPESARPEPEPATPEHQPASLESEGIPLVARAPAVDLDDEPPTSIVTPAAAELEQPSEPAAPASKPVPARSETVVGPAPSPPRGETVVGPPPSPPKDLAVVPDASLEDEEAPTQIRTVESVTQGKAAEEARKAPHTLPSDRPAAKPQDDGAKRVEIKRKPVRAEDDVASDEDRPKKRPRFESQLPVIDEPPKGSALGTAVVVILALLAIGLVAASVMQKNTPDPRPLLEDLYRQYMK